MTDLYLKTTSRSALDTHLQGHGIVMESDYFQNEAMIVDWIGKVPEVTDTETGEVMVWSVGYRFNVRLIDEETTIFDGFTAVHPETPYRRFS